MAAPHAFHERKSLYHTRAITTTLVYFETEHSSQGFIGTTTLILSELYVSLILESDGGVAQW